MKGGKKGCLFKVLSVILSIFSQCISQDEGDPNAAQKVFILGNKCQEFQKNKGFSSYFCCNNKYYQ